MSTSDYPVDHFDEFDPIAERWWVLHDRPFYGWPKRIVCSAPYCRQTATAVLGSVSRTWRGVAACDLPGHRDRAEAAAVHQEAS